MATTSMDDILSDKPEQQEKPQPEAEQPAAAAEPAERPEKPEKPQSRRRDHQRREWEAQGRDPETGQFVAKEKPEPEKAAPPEAKAEPKKEEPAKAGEKPAQPEFTERERALLKAAEDERRKRQHYEQELARVRQPQPQPAAQQPEKRGFWDDPEAYFQTQQKTWQQQAVQTKLQTAELLARSRYKDFDEKIEKFAEMVQSTPGLAQQWLGAADPGEFAYRTAASHMAIEQAGSMEKLLEEAAAKARAEERAKVEAEFKAKEEAAAQKRAALPGSLSDVTGGGRKPAPAWTGPTSMADILKH